MGLRLLLVLGGKRGSMKDHVEQRKDVLTPPMPGIAPKGEEDQIDVESEDAKSIAPSEGSGLTGDVEATDRPDGKSEWMQDA